MAAVPGGVGGEIPALFQTPDVTPFVLLLSLATAAALGAAHALTPGHGKSLMAAYLVGTRGTPVHAIGLGLSVSASHTLGILALAAVIVGAQGVLSPDLVVRTAPLLAAAGIVAIGAWMLISELRRRHAARTAAHDHDHEHGTITTITTTTTTTASRTATGASPTATCPRRAPASRGGACSYSGWQAG